jgi:hypothetical protein
MKPTRSRPIRASHKGLTVVLCGMLLAGCDPRPVHMACNYAWLKVPDSEILSRMQTRGRFGSYCSEPIPTRVLLEEGSTKVEVRVRSEWVDLRASRDGQALSIQGPGISSLPADGYTHMLRPDQLSTGRIELAVSDGTRFSIPFSTTRCTCVGHDAI